VVEHRVEQQSLPWVQDAPVARQLEHFPAMHTPLQHSAPIVHSAASGRQVMHVPFRHCCEQHCDARVHEPPVPTQLTQRSPEHRPEQHWLGSVQNSPFCRQVTQVPPWQIPEQHCPASGQGWLSGVQAVEQMPFWQKLEQHWVFCVHWAPWGRQLTHRPPWQSPEQQSAALVQAVPSGRQGEHCPLTQKPVQHGAWPSPPQAPPVAVQLTHWPPWQKPVQQSEGSWQPVPPRGMQLAQTPPRQRPEQQSLSTLQPLPPASMHAEQVPFAQRPEQHCALVWQGEPSGKQPAPGGPHTRPPSPSTQDREQQSLDVVQEAPSGRHAAWQRKPTPPSGSGTRVHTPEQHSWPKEHSTPVCRQGMPPSGTNTPPSTSPGPPKQRLTPSIVSTQQGSTPPTKQPSYFPFGRMGRFPHWWRVVPPKAHTSPGAFGPSFRLQRLNPVAAAPQPDCGEVVSRQDPEQQSSSRSQTSHAGRQPPRNWQVGAPEPSSAHALEQHSPLVLQGSRAAWHALMSKHSPLSHLPEQHSVAARHTSPPALHVDENAHRKSEPPANTQRLEQQMPGEVGLQISPAGRHE
jgi:hypothetical protein